MTINKESSKMGIGIVIFVFGILAMYISKMLIEYVLPSLDIMYVLIGSILLSGWVLYLILNQINI